MSEVSGISRRVGLVRFVCSPTFYAEIDRHALIKHRSLAHSAPLLGITSLLHVLLDNMQCYNPITSLLKVGSQAFSNGCLLLGEEVHCSGDGREDER